MEAEVSPPGSTVELHLLQCAKKALLFSQYLSTAVGQSTIAICSTASLAWQSRYFPLTMAPSSIPRQCNISNAMGAQIFEYFLERPRSRCSLNLFSSQPKLDLEMWKETGLRPTPMPAPRMSY